MKAYLNETSLPVPGLPQESASRCQTLCDIRIEFLTLIKIKSLPPQFSHIYIFIFVFFNKLWFSLAKDHKMTWPISTPEYHFHMVCSHFLVNFDPNTINMGNFGGKLLIFIRVKISILMSNNVWHLEDREVSFRYAFIYV